MDFESLKNQVSNLTLYDIKAGVRKVQNGESVVSATFGVMLTLESRYEPNRDGVQGQIVQPTLSSATSLLCDQVREATNGDPWGASASLMQEIAQGTHN